MKVRIKKEGKKKEFNLINSWSDVTLKTWLELAKFEGLSKSEEAEETIAALSDIPKKLIKELSIQDVAVILGKIAELQQEENTSLKKIVEIEGKKYGWHPDLSSITLGEYADIESLLKNGVENNLPQVMAILYRPIIAEGENDTYTIEAYDGNIDIRAEEMKKMSAEQVQNALRFFFAFGKILSLTLELYLMERMKEMKMQLPPNPLPTSGHGSE